MQADNFSVSPSRMIDYTPFVASFSTETIRVYQAFSNEIADSALQNNKFVSPPFKTDRMTWIKPSFFWMMYRSNWARNKNQERVLAIDITRTIFEQLVSQAVLSSFDGTIYDSYDNWRERLKNSEIRIQWDPDRNIKLERLTRKAIQIGLSGNSIRQYMSEWIVQIQDITRVVHTIKENIDLNCNGVSELAPVEIIYRPS